MNMLNTANAQKALLKINKKAFALLHEAENMDFTKPYLVAKYEGNFTANALKKFLKKLGADFDNNEYVVNLFMTTTSRRSNGCFYVTSDDNLQSFNIENERHNIISRYDFHAYYSRRNFEDARKSASTISFIVIQNIKYKTTYSAPVLNYNERFKWIENSRLTCITFSYSIGVNYYSSIAIQPIGEAANLGVKSYSVYPSTAEVSMCTDINNIIDKSGYILFEHRKELKKRAKELALKKEKEKLMNTDFTDKITELKNKIEASRSQIIEVFTTAQSKNSLYNIYNALYYFREMYNEFNYHVERINNQSYNSVKAVNNAFNNFDALIERITATLTMP